MRATILAIAAALSVTVAGQNLLDRIPKCAQNCFGNNLGTCGPLDIACICGNKEIITGVSCCVFDTCTQDEIKTTIDFATSLCSTQGVQVDTSPECPANGTSSGNSTSAAPSGSATASLTQISGSASPSASGASAPSTAGAAAPYMTAGAGLVGAAVAGMLAVL